MAIDARSHVVRAWRSLVSAETRRNQRGGHNQAAAAP
jgi:hypothetical protein